MKKKKIKCLRNLLLKRKYFKNVEKNFNKENKNHLKGNFMKIFNI